MGIFDLFKKRGNADHPKTAEQRKKETEKLLKSLNIPFIDHLPLIEEENEARIRTGQEIAKRILILTYLNYVLEVPGEKEKVIDFLTNNLLWNEVSPEEKELFLKEELTEQEATNISWRSEAIWLLLWAIHKVDTLALPTRQVAVDDILSSLPYIYDDPKEFIDTAQVRATTEILDLSDLTYRLHWATRNGELNNLKVPDLDSGIVMERHYAINWVTYYAEEWDEITTDT